MASVAAERTELKEEGIIEAATELAEDPQSKVNPEKIEETLVKETREAGGVAYQFDPDASPADKAAAAEAVRSSTSCPTREREMSDRCYPLERNAHMLIAASDLATAAGITSR